MKQTDLITEEITGAALTVAIGGRDCVVAYPMHNILLFKKQSGLSLFAKGTWDKLDFEEDSEAWTACLWAGLHVRQDDGSWKAPFTIAELNRPEIISFHNAVSIHNAMFRALTNWMPRKKTEVDPESEKKNLTVTPCQSPEMTAEGSPETTSASSGSALTAVSDLIVSNS